MRVISKCNHGMEVTMTEEKVQIQPYPLGVYRLANGIRVAFVSKVKNCGIILFDKKTGRKLQKVSFQKGERMGNVYYMFIPNVNISNISYLFFEGDNLIPDYQGKLFTKKGHYGKRRAEVDLKAQFLTKEFHWNGDENPRILYENCICYCMHVRGFTKHTSSKVTYKGTYKGIIEKIDYLKQLGITTIELQPTYEFLEMPKENELETDYPHSQMLESQDKVNYWGYKKGFYYAPKAHYAAGDDASYEFKEMVRALHANGIEVIMQFYFPAETLRQEIPEILRFWVMEYHVDGFHLMGEDLSINMLAADPALVDTKMWYYNFDVNTIYDTNEEPCYRNLATYTDDYMYDMRCFLKGDEDKLESVLYHMRTNPTQTGRIHYLTNYNGFTLMDLVSYDRKHNELNGEENYDGVEYNHSWNCGVEGASRKKQITLLRYRQIKNALSLLFLSQTTPLLFMGDEFGNSQKGNNNPYCQDNNITWLNWTDLDKNREIYDFTAKLISFRQEYKILQQRKELRLMDYLACGYPDLSYHGGEAWRPSLAYYNRHIGIMYCGMYDLEKTSEDYFLYVAFNMHWESHEFAMPKLPKGMKWEVYLQTNEISKTSSNEVPPRSVVVFISKKEKLSKIRK